MKTCKNCNNEFLLEFCNKCGQKETHRITMSHIGHELLHSVTHADKGFFHLLIQLFQRPGLVAREYILEGKRKRYFMPFQYILIIGTIAVFVAVNSHYMENTLQIANASQDLSEKKLRLVTKIGVLFSKYFNFLVLVQLPFLAFGSFLMFRKHRLNYAEHLTMQTFFSAQTTILSMILMIVLYLTQKSGLFIAPLMALISFAYQVFAVTQFFKELNFGGIIKSLVAHIIGLILFMVFIIVVMIFIILVIK